MTKLIEGKKKTMKVQLIQQSTRKQKNKILEKYEIQNKK